MLSFLMFVLLGLVAGLIARALMPGKQSMSIAMTTVLGMVGSFLGGLVASLFTGESILTFHRSGIIASVLGALAVLFVAAAVGRRSHRHATI